MDNIIQIEKLHYAKISGERTLLHDLTNNCPGKSENSVFCKEAAPPPPKKKIILESTRGGFLF